MAKTILVVDDEPSIRVILKKILEKQGYDVLTAENGVTATELFDVHAPDLVVIDLIMPEKDGIETIRELKSANPDLPIIAISGGGLIKPDLYLKMAKKFGAVHSFQKPIDRKELCSLVSDLLADTA